MATNFCDSLLKVRVSGKVARAESADCIWKWYYSQSALCAEGFAVEGVSGGAL
jgi:hypothetical protein